MYRTALEKAEKKGDALPDPGLESAAVEPAPDMESVMETSTGDVPESAGGDQQAPRVRICHENIFNFLHGFCYGN